MIKSQLVNSINDYGEVVLSEDQAVDAMLHGLDISSACIDDENSVSKYDSSVSIIDVGDAFPVLYKEKKKDMEASKHLYRRSMSWKIPSEYLYMDIIEFLINQCDSEEEIARVEAEILEFHKRDEMNILRVMKYIVDTFRQRGVVWGVGRGSSVSCFCLYLIGINKINPLKYGIPYTEYFKD